MQKRRKEVSKKGERLHETRGLRKDPVDAKTKIGIDTNGKERRVRDVAAVEKEKEQIYFSH